MGGIPFIRAKFEVPEYRSFFYLPPLFVGIQKVRAVGGSPSAPDFRIPSLKPHCDPRPPRLRS